MPQLVGNVVHRAVEWLYKSEPEARDRAAADRLLAAALAEELSKPTYDVLKRDGDPRPEVTAKGEDALDGLFELEDPKTITVGEDGLEIWVSAELYGAPVRGRIDRLYDAQGAEIIADYKTGKVPRPAFAPKAFFGLWTYAAALAASAEDKHLADRVELLYLIGRERLSRPVIRPTALEHAKVLARIWRQIDDRIRLSEVTVMPSRLCDWCGFKSACPAFENKTPPIGSGAHDELLVSLGLIRSDRATVATAVERVETTQPLGDDE